MGDAVYKVYRSAAAEENPSGAESKPDQNKTYFKSCHEKIKKKKAFLSLLIHCRRRFSFKFWNHSFFMDSDHKTKIDVATFSSFLFPFSFKNVIIEREKPDKSQTKLSQFGD